MLGQDALGIAAHRTNDLAAVQRPDFLLPTLSALFGGAVHTSSHNDTTKAANENVLAAAKKVSSRSAQRQGTGLRTITAVNANSTAANK